MKPTLMAARRGSAPPGSCTRPGQQTPPAARARAPEAGPAELPATSGPLPTAYRADGTAPPAWAANPRSGARRGSGEGRETNPRADQSAAGTSGGPIRGRELEPCARPLRPVLDGQNIRSRGRKSWTAPRVFAWRRPQTFGKHLTGRASREENSPPPQECKTNLDVLRALRTRSLIP
ncbi:uncharacterized protein LOC115288009 isoform X2 [Suricata suricatta]|uniref:uncharacterized protein LOC115288009 isoform X2 n=1 Tax=Suricata suricatta TaxID=37032 RepID=UPI0011554CF0|nr:uncharacterized protein LOC115288009 isoform X2 [Suricata suricatta]